MSDLISRGKLFNLLAPVQTLGEAYGIIQGMDTVDAVPVVKCRDCRWWHDWSGECYAKEAQGFGHLWKAEDYCSYGLRKDDNHEQTKKPE